jgi:hypothetical protein
MEYQTTTTKVKKEKKEGDRKTKKTPSSLVEEGIIESKENEITEMKATSEEVTFEEATKEEENQVETVVVEESNFEYENKLYENSSNYAQLFEETNTNNKEKYMEYMRIVNDALYNLKNIPLTFTDKTFKKEALKENKKLSKNYSEYQSHIIATLSSDVDELVRLGGKKRSSKKKKDPESTLNAPIYKPLEKVEECLIDFIKSDPNYSEDTVISRASIMVSLYNAITDDMKVPDNKSFVNVNGRLRTLFDEVEKIAENKLSKDIEKWKSKGILDENGKIPNQIAQKYLMSYMNICIPKKNEM